MKFSTFLRSAFLDHSTPSGILIFLFKYQIKTAHILQGQRNCLWLKLALPLIDTVVATATERLIKKIMNKALVRTDAPLSLLTAVPLQLHLMTCMRLRADQGAKSKAISLIC